MYYLFEGNTGKQTHIPTLPLCMAPAEADPADYRPEALLVEFSHVSKRRLSTGDFDNLCDLQSLVNAFVASKLANAQVWQTIPY